MEPVTLATAVGAVIFSEALKEGGKNLGAMTFEQIGKLVSTIAAKTGRKEEEIRHLSREVFEDEVITIFHKDQEFFNHIQTWMQSIQSESSVQQILLEDVQGKSIKIDQITQKSPIQEGKIEQVIARKINIDGEISISNVNQQ